MISLNDLFLKTQRSFKTTEEFLTKAQPIFKNGEVFFKHSFKILTLIAKKSYSLATFVVSKTFEYLSIFVRSSAHFSMFSIDKTCTFMRYLNRRIYVWKILSVRYRWYLGKKGNLYNPKLQATITPMWECSWNLKRSDEQHNGFESKEQAQNLAFKLWMKRRLLQKRLEQHNSESRIPITFTQKIILNQKILPNKIQLRKATVYDAAQIHTLIEKKNSSQNDPRVITRIQTYLDKPDHHLLVATRGKSVVGFIAFVIYDLFLVEGKRCRIEGLVVDDNLRDLGVKKKLMQTAESFARDHNSVVIDLIDGMCRSKDGTHDFYKYLGYNNEGSMAKMYLRKEL